MSGPLHDDDTAGTRETSAAIEVFESRHTEVGSMSVRRALPQRARRSIGAWCFADHLGPTDPSSSTRPDIGPHPHMGLHTITWLVEGELVHHDSLGSEQSIKPGQLNVMTAGRGVSHAEEAREDYRGGFHGIQLWIAQPDATRSGDPGFEHHANLPRIDIDGGRATVLVGAFGNATSAARRDGEYFGAELDLHGDTEFAVDVSSEHGMIVLSGSITLDARTVIPGQLLYLAPGLEGIHFEASDARVLLIGGEPLDHPLLMWWNFVARERQEMVDAYEHWSADDGWFGTTRSALARVEVGPPPWLAAH